MTFFRSIVLLASVVLFVAFALFAGHALAVHETTPLFFGLGFLLAGAALVYAQTRVGGKA